MEGTAEAKVKVKVGVWEPDGKFTGEVLRFSGEMVGAHRELIGETDTRKDRGIDYMLYRTSDGSYRVHVQTWSDWENERQYARLLPNSAQSGAHIHADDPEKEGHPIQYDTIQYYTYTEAEARAEFPFPQLFAGIGEPSVDDNN